MRVHVIAMPMDMIMFFGSENRVDAERSHCDPEIQGPEQNEH